MCSPDLLSLLNAVRLKTNFSDSQGVKNITIEHTFPVVTPGQLVERQIDMKEVLKWQPLATLSRSCCLYEGLIVIPYPGWRLTRTRLSC